ncbi:MAG TPA: hypothetical protein VK395_08475 [Gemmataceae bacterium]|nr:hypothetical protein [Gemmataceae bacterium]
MIGRQRLLKIGLPAVMGVAGAGFFFQQMFLGPLEEQNAVILTARKEVAQKRERIEHIDADSVRLRHWRQISLPDDVDLARREYETYLIELMQRSDFRTGSFTVLSQPPDNFGGNSARSGKKPAYTRLVFTVQARGTLASLTEMLARFYRTALLHQIADVEVTRAASADPNKPSVELDLNLTIEALVLNGAESRPYLLPNINRTLLAIDILTLLRGGAPLAQVPWSAGPAGPLGPRRLKRPQEYAVIAARDIFHSPVPVIAATKPAAEKLEMTRFVFLTDIAHTDNIWEAFFYNHHNQGNFRVCAKAGSESFQVQDNLGNIALRGKVVRIGKRDVVFEVDNKYFSIHIGQNLYEALTAPLPMDRVQALKSMLAKAKTTDKP